MSLLMQTVTAIRNIRGEMRISPGADADGDGEGGARPTSRCCASTRRSSRRWPARA